MSPAAQASIQFSLPEAPIGSPAPAVTSSRTMSPRLLPCEVVSSSINSSANNPAAINVAVESMDEHANRDAGAGCDLDSVSGGTPFDPSFDLVNPNTAIKGRGALSNRTGRFDSWQHVAVDDGWNNGNFDNQGSDSCDSRAPNDHECSQSKGSQSSARVDIPTRQVTIDNTRRIIARNKSPDVPFDRSINPYRGCEHGCVYCFARPTHTYLGYSAGLDFETQIVAKPAAAALLRDELVKPDYQCDVIAMGTNTDPYQPLEKERGITREILEVLSQANHPVSFVTKSALICRDIDILASMAERSLAQVWVSVTSLDNQLSAKLEPRAAAPHKRLATIRRLSEAGIPVGVLVAPVIPFLTDSEFERIAERARDAGASAIGTVMLRLPHEVADLMQEWLDEHTPAKARHVMSLVQQLSGGKNYDSRWGIRQRGTGVYAKLFAQRLSRLRDKLGLAARLDPLDRDQFCVPSAWRNEPQLALF